MTALTRSATAGSRSVISLKSHHASEPTPTVSGHSSVALLFFDQRPFTEELPRAEASDELEVTMHVDITLEHDEEFVCEVVLFGEAAASEHLALTEDVGAQSQLLVGQSCKQRNRPNLFYIHGNSIIDQRLCARAGGT
jgi:hypothetical protein